jgi:hypothetical protein
MSMRTFAIVIALCVGTSTLALAGEMTLVQRERLDPLQIPPDPHACWSQTGDLNGGALSSEVIDSWELEAEVANDFIFEEDSEIILARWWSNVW